jgi:hypothetical protein
MSPNDFYAGATAAFVVILLTQHTSGVIMQVRYTMGEALIANQRAAVQALDIDIPQCKARRSFRMSSAAAPVL